MKIVIISSSLTKESNSLILAKYAQKYIQKKADIEVQLINLQDHPLPLCCPDDAEMNKNVIGLENVISAADALIFSTPIYNYEVNAALKNLLDLTGKAWNEKVIGMMCSAGGNNSYMAVMGFANSLMLNFRCIIIPRFVYASDDAFNEAKNEISSKKIISRIKELCDTTIKLGKAIKMND